MAEAVVTGAAPAPWEAELSVQGMTCAACAARVEKKLNGIDGVRATVNFATERALVVAPTSVTARHLVEAVTEAGYRGEILDRGGSGPAGDNPPTEAGDELDAARVAYLKKRLIVATRRAPQRPHSATPAPAPAQPAGAEAAALEVRSTGSPR